jgi:enoyl-[acyl-carrier protein] reductase / trans-2-enoyl-CoA reductase (NAD+)
MKEHECHEGCIQQMYRLFHDKLSWSSSETDKEGLIRMDDWEMREDIQKEVSALWKDISTENVEQIADIKGYWEDFYQIFGFSVPGVDYGKDVSLDVSIPSLTE